MYFGEKRKVEIYLKKGTVLKFPTSILHQVYDL